MDNYIVNYTTINHTARLELGITNTEYVFLDLVCNLSNDPRFDKWCIAKKTKLAEIAEISEQHIHRLIKKFTTGKYTKDNITFTCPILLEKDIKTKNIRTNSLWYETVVIKKVLIQKYREDRKQKKTATPKDSFPKSSPNDSGSKSQSPNDFATNITELNEKPKKDLNYFLGKYKEINPLNYEKFFKIKAHREAEQKLWDALGTENLDLLHDRLSEINKTPYVSHSYTPSELLNNYPKYENQHNINKQMKNSKGDKRRIYKTEGGTP